MIAGVGLDLVETARFGAAMERHRARLLTKLFTAGERETCEARHNRVIHYSARFAAKEAVLKALGTGWSGGIRWTDVEVVREESGAVRVALTGAAREVARRHNITTVHLNLTHTRHYAAAVAVAER